MGAYQAGLFCVYTGIILILSFNQVRNCELRTTRPIDKSAQDNSAH